MVNPRDIAGECRRRRRMVNPRDIAGEHRSRTRRRMVNPRDIAGERRSRRRRRPLFFNMYVRRPPLVATRRQPVRRSTRSSEDKQLWQPRWNSCFWQPRKTAASTARKGSCFWQPRKTAAFDSQERQLLLTAEEDSCLWHQERQLLLTAEEDSCLWQPRTSNLTVKDNLGATWWCNGQHVCFSSLSPMLECGFQPRLGLELSSFRMWHFLKLVVLRVLRFPPLLHRLMVSADKIKLK